MNSTIKSQTNHQKKIFIYLYHSILYIYMYIYLLYHLMNSYIINLKYHR